MENASKALIIAGAILLAIVIISLGLIVVNNTRETIQNSNLSEQEIQNFNSKFTSYEGTINASQVNTLIQQVISTNQALQSEGKSDFVIIQFMPGNKSVHYDLTIDASGNYIGKAGGTDVLTDLPGETRVKGYNAKEVEGIQYSVKSGKNYTVKVYYKNSIVKLITVKANS